MGLDDFKEPPTEEDIEREKELSKQSPPDASTKWSDYEPGAPHWINDICGGTVSAKGIDTFDSDKILYVRLDTTEESGSRITIASDVYVNLDETL